MKAITKWKKKLKEINKIAKSAIKNKPNWKAPKGLSYIKDVPVGQLVKVGSQKAIIVEHTDVSTIIHCIECQSDEKSFYLGRHRWGRRTEVQTI